MTSTKFEKTIVELSDTLNLSAKIAIKNGEFKELPPQRIDHLLMGRVYVYGPITQVLWHIKHLYTSEENLLTEEDANKKYFS